MARVSPRRLKGSMPNSNEPYTIASLGPAAMAAKLVVTHLTALRKLVASLVLNCGGLPNARSSRAMAAETRAARAYFKQGPIPHRGILPVR